MPGMTGIELTAKVQRLNPSIPIILCTGCSEWIPDLRMDAVGIRECLVKPVVARELAEVICRLV